MAVDIFLGPCVIALAIYMAWKVRSYSLGGSAAVEPAEVDHEARAIARYVAKRDTWMGGQRVFLTTPIGWITSTDRAFRHLPFIRSSTLKLEHADDKLFKAYGVVSKPDLVYRSDDGLRICIEYKSQAATYGRQDRYWVSKIRDEDCMQALIAAWCVEQDGNGPARAVVRVPNGMIVLQAPPNLDQAIKDSVQSARSLLGLSYGEPVWSSRLAQIVLIKMRGQRKAKASGWAAQGEELHEQFVG